MGSPVKKRPKSVTASLEAERAHRVQEKKEAKRDVDHISQEMKKKKPQKYWARFGYTANDVALLRTYLQGLPSVDQRMFVKDRWQELPKKKIFLEKRVKRY